MKRTQLRAYSLIEVLLAVSMITIIIGFSLPFYWDFKIKNDLDLGVNSVVQAMRRGQILAQSMTEDSPWGVKIHSENITVFQGPYYLSRDKNHDEYFELSGSIRPSGLNEVIFTKLSGYPLEPGTITLTSSNGQKKNISINSRGFLDY